MRRVIKKYIIPHKGNNHTPHLLREAGVAGLLIVIVGIFGISFIQTELLKTTNLAAVVAPTLVDLTNADRQTQKLSALKVNPLLTEAAQMKANDMASKGYFSHTTPEGYSPWHWFDLVGYNFIYAGENLAVNFTESSDVENAWMNSPGHRSNILNDKFTEIGIATQSGTYQGQSAIFVTQMFGTPMPTAIAVATKKTTTTSSLKPQSTPAKPSGQVKGETIAVTEVSTTSASTTAPQETFIAAEQVSTTSAASTIQTPLAGTTAPVHYASIIEKALSKPREVMVYIYTAIAALIILVMGLIILGEYKRHHIKHIMYGGGLLVVMLVLMYVLSAVIPQVIIV